MSSKRRQSKRIATRQAKVVQLYLEGTRQMDIARELGISQSIVCRDIAAYQKQIADTAGSQATLPVTYHTAKQPKPRPPRPIRLPDPPKAEGECLYLIRSENNLTKIGYSSNPVKRFRILASLCPVSLELIYVSEPIQIGQSIEQRLHFEYRDKWVRGEWFDLTEQDVNEIIAHIVGVAPKLQLS